MSATVKLMSALPGDPETNGLDSIVEQLIETPEDLVMVVAWIDVHHITDQTDTGARIPSVRVRRIEPLGAADTVSEALRTAVIEAGEKRLGKKPLPFGQVEATKVEVLDDGA